MKRLTLEQALEEAYTTNICIGYLTPHSKSRKRYYSKSCFKEFYTQQDGTKEILLYTEVICPSCRKEVKDIESLLGEA